MPKLLNFWAIVKFGGKLIQIFIILWLFLQLWDCQVTQKLMFLKLQVTLGSNFMLVLDRIPKEGVWGAKIDNNWFFHFFFITVRVRLKKDFGSPKRLSYIEFLSYFKSSMTVICILVTKKSFLNPISFLFCGFLKQILTVLYSKLP